jgi:S-DNA-T family DNA segregation ATPase FtsK/SpoIIIE
MDVLAELLAVIDTRGPAMVGRSRLHQPTAGDPLHVLVIDELAALTAYADPDIRRQATRLLSEVLTQGRALGVVVVAMVQDPRKETVSMRGLFTQTVALRLRSSEETRMVLGDGMAALAPAHRISPAAPGTGYVVGDDGTVDLVRADWWSDDLVRQAADTYPAAVSTPATPSGEPASEAAEVAALVAFSDRPRKRRSPRASRRPAPVVLDDEVAP